jgi:phosphoenolpyruvate synthase/pyruvate phosphate dikinase
LQNLRKDRQRESNELRTRLHKMSLQLTQQKLSERKSKEEVMRIYKLYQEMLLLEKDLKERMRAVEAQLQQQMQEATSKQMQMQMEMDRLSDDALQAYTRLQDSQRLLEQEQATVKELLQQNTALQQERDKWQLEREKRASQTHWYSLLTVVSSWTLD